MKIVFVSLASAYTEGMSYQENLLANQLRTDDKELTIISDTHEFVCGVITKTQEEERILSNGAKLIRLKYRNFLGEFISSKVRAVKGLYEILEKEQPNVIFHHGLQSFELLTVTKYIKNNPNVKLYLDCHSDFNNSATNTLSKHILHKVFYKSIIRKSLQYVEKIFCVAYESFDFCRQLYGVKDDIMEFFPLGGVIVEGDAYQEKRKRKRRELNLKDDDILIMHSGKMDKLKRTEELIDAFLQVPSCKLKLVLIGCLHAEIKQNVLAMISTEKRISFLGWKKGEELLEYLCACDLYAQPGGQSATLQNALCCGSAATVYPHQSYKFLLKDSVFYVESVDDMKRNFEDIINNRKVLEYKRNQANIIAHEVLDYKMLASRLYKETN